MSLHFPGQILVVPLPGCMVVILVMEGRDGWLDGGAVCLFLDGARVVGIGHIVEPFPLE